ncbi:MAG: hypothetical protein CME88_02930 [Hirschia sp.]|nr:hypothetical protein [Hirschia sp.]MBF17315.1 hypothetical protein [Hirschia sp.]|tara:strand:+ start:161 stop:733 length:573 start_codon:yes stop_codon:yes gene_type:complete
MKYFIGVALAAVGVQSVTPVLAQETGTSHFHAGIGSTGIGYEVGNSDEIIALSTLTVRGGYDFNRFIGLEGEASVGLNDDEVIVYGNVYGAKVESQFGAYAMGKIPVHRNVDLFARAGYANLSLEESRGYYYNTTVSDSYSGVAGSLGVQAFFGGHHGFRVEVGAMDLGDKNGFDKGNVATFSLGYAFRN